ncbi:MAG: metal ABC transporter substrate-binding protein [Planctomycetota bacterium]
MRSANRFVPCWLASFVILCTIGCAESESRSGHDGTKRGTPQVYTVNYPLAFFAQQIGGEHVDVRFPVPENQDPTLWEPSVEDVTRLQSADLILVNGADYAPWVKRVSLPRSKVVNTTEEARQEYIDGVESVTHQHGPDGEHTHTALASTTWLDLQIAITQLRSVKDALVKLVPNQSEVFEGRFVKLETELKALDQELLDAWSSDEPAPVLSAQPVYQYLARRYGLRVESVRWEPDEMPDEEAWKELAASLETTSAKAMLWQTEPIQEIRAELKRLGISVVVYSPASNRPKSGDFIRVMKENVASMINSRK